MKNFTHFFFFIAIVSSCITSFSQDKKSVVIGSMISKPNAILILNPSNGDQGVLLPQLTTAKRLSILPTSPADDGLLVFDTTEKSFYYWKNSQWTKGLGNPESNRDLSLAGNTLTITDGASINLSNLIAVGQVSGVLSNLVIGSNTIVSSSIQDGAVTTPDLGNLSVTQAKISDGAVTNIKIADVAPSKILSAGALTGEVLKWNGTNWIPQPDNGGGLGTVTSIATGTSLIGGPITTTGIIDLANGGVTTLKLLDASVTNAKIATGVSVGKLTAGTDGQVLSSASGIPVWITPPSGGSVTNITTGIGLTGGPITSTGTIALADDGVTSAKLQDDATTDANRAVSTNHIRNASVTDAKIAPGITASKLIPSAINAQVLTTVAGVTTWANISGAPPTGPAGGNLAGTYPNPTIGTTAGSNIVTAINDATTTGSINTSRLNSGVLLDTESPAAGDVSGNFIAGLQINASAVTTVEIANGTIATADIADASVTNSKIAPGVANQVLITNPGLAVQWVNQSSLSSNLSAAGEVSGALGSLNISANTITSGKIVDETITSSDIFDGSISTADLANSSVTAAKLANTLVTAGSYGTSVSVSQISVDAQGRLTNAASVPIVAAGDVTGAISSTTVVRLQGNQVSSGALGVPDAGKILVWSGTQWVPQIVSGTNSLAQSYIIDPSDFINLRLFDKKDKDNMVIFEENSTFISVIKRDEGNSIISPFHLPQGALIQQITLYYMDRDPKNIRFDVYRKTFTGSNDPIITTWTSSVNSSSVLSQSHLPIGGKGVIDNDLYSYRVVIKLDPSNDTNNDTDADHRIYAVRIIYLPQ